MHGTRGIAEWPTGRISKYRYAATIYTGRTIHYLYAATIRQQALWFLFTCIHAQDAPFTSCRGLTNLGAFLSKRTDRGILDNFRWVRGS